MLEQQPARKTQDLTASCPVPHNQAKICSLSQKGAERMTPGSSHECLRVFGWPPGMVYKSDKTRIAWRWHQSQSVIETDYEAVSWAEKVILSN